MEKVLVSKKFWIAILFFIYIGLFFLRQTNLAASDLGRHVKNGEVILTTGKVFHTNLYSYTNPDFPAPNHHWLFGVISYWIFQASGFEGLTIVVALLYTSAIAIVFYHSVKKSSFIPVAIATLLALPLLTDRAETRPEAFSLFFFSILFCLFAWTLEKNHTKHTKFISVGTGLLMAAWINIHIFFVLSGVLGGTALIDAVINKKFKSLKSILIICGTLVGGAFLNPLGLELVLYPLQIFNNYGYRVSENQSLWFFLGHYTRPIHWYLAFFIAITSITSWFAYKNIFKKYFYYIVVATFFLFFTNRLIRMENIFALTAIPVLSFAFNAYWSAYKEKCIEYWKNTGAMMVISIVGFGVLCLALGTGLFFPFQRDTGVGLLPGYNNSITFVKNLPVTGPIFNNFDSGSFLIYSLYPKNKVFVDNRAEAYPREFLQNVYLKAQEDDEVWKALESQYQFASIIFYRHEQTNWGQEFLIKRVQDSSWIPIYVDNYLIIFLKDIPVNKELIEKYRLPSEMFSINPI